MAKAPAKSPVSSAASALAGQSPAVVDPFATPAPTTTPETAPAGDVSKGPKLIRKLSAKNIIGKIDPKTLPLEFKPLYRLAGVVTGYESGESGFGPWECLTGEFAAVVVATGEIFAGNKAFVPSGQGDGIVAAAAHALRNDAKAKIKFAVDIAARQVMRGTELGYEYNVIPLVKINVKNEALDMLSNLPA